MQRIIVQAAVLALVSAAPMAHAETIRNSNAGKAGIGADAGDPNRIVCRKEQETGSRLRGRQVCLKASEWTERNAQNRQLVERAQNSKWSSE